MKQNERGIMWHTRKCMCWEFPQLFGHQHNSCICSCAFVLYRSVQNTNWVSKVRVSSICFSVFISSRRRGFIELMFVFLQIEKFICEYFPCIWSSEHTYRSIIFFVFIVHCSLFCHHLLLTYYYFVVINWCWGWNHDLTRAKHTLNHWATVPGPFTMICYHLIVLSILDSWHGKTFAHGWILTCMLSGPLPI